MKVNSQPSKLKARQFVTDLASRGIYHFTTSDLENTAGVSSVAARSALRRLAKNGDVVMPCRGFFLVLPPEYRTLGCLPADQFVPDLMEHIGQPYYAALLTAAQYHGVAPQQPMRFQVMTTLNRRPINCGRVMVEFVAKQELLGPTSLVNTKAGRLRISSAELTALDLVGYVNRAGGLDYVATLLSQLGAKLHPSMLADTAKLVPLPWVQRLGYLLEVVGQKEVADSLRPLVRDANERIAPLAPGTTVNDAPKNRDWMLAINTDVEPEL